MADLTKDFEYYDAPVVQLVDDIVVFHNERQGFSIEVSLEELTEFIKEANK